jgi:hypothetical protein
MAEIERHVLYRLRKQKHWLSESMCDANFVERVGILPAEIRDY